MMGERGAVRIAISAQAQIVIRKTQSNVAVLNDMAVERVKILAIDYRNHVTEITFISSK